jgi:transposase
MTYSLDLRQRVVNFVKKGGSKSEASRRYEVSRWCVYDWCQRDDLAPKKVERRARKLNWEALRRDVQENPDALLRERAERFGVKTNAIWYALQKMKQTCKKNSALRTEENR